MKKTLAIALVLGVLSLGAVAYGHGGSGWSGGPGWGGGYGWCGGPGMMYGYGPGMMYGYGPGYGPMMGYGPGWGHGPGWNAPDYQSPEAKKFFASTADLRKQLNDKMFEYREAYRSGDDKKAESLEKEIDGIRDQLRKKAKEAGFAGGWGAQRGYGYGPR